ncbi:MAG: putative TIM-barrel fold metal-dependent hydrolase [Rhodothermales bacterium]|jgi:predicted TIM-barrel fold metal-dependent hydrolase
MHRVLLPLVALFLVAGCAATEEPQTTTPKSATQQAPWILPPDLAAVPEKLEGMTIEEYEPVSTLRVPGFGVPSSKYPFVDVHGHWFRASGFSAGQVDTLVAQFDSLNMAVSVNLSGGAGDRLERAIANTEGRHPSRFVTFANVNFDSVGAPGWTERAVAQLAADFDAGARGLKIYKSLGMDVRDIAGDRVAVDDPRLDPIWALCGERGMPVLIHTADPAMFWQPRNMHNERWLELRLRAQRYRPADQFPPFDTIMGEQHSLFSNHPGTTFIAAHLGWLGSDLDQLGALLDANPNVYTEIGAVVQELGRQPRFAASWLTQYKDRVLFGKDFYNPVEFHTYFRVLETDHEYFPYYRKYHAFWRLYGLALPEDVLRAIYYENALRIIPGLERSLFPTA